MRNARLAAVASLATALLAAGCGGAKKSAAESSAAPASGGTPWVARHGLTAAQYQTTFTHLVKKGYRLKTVSGYTSGGAVRYAALWVKQGGPAYAARHGVPGAFYQDVFDNLYYQGYQPVYVNGFASGSSSRLNAIWENTTWKSADLELIGDKVAAYMTTHSIPGLALAITKDGRLVYAGGFGLADKSTGQEASPTQLFRIASVSKPITPVAVMRLLEQGKLTSLDLNVNRFDAHGGWLASAIDLTRFMVRVDGLGTKPDIVNGTDYTTMTTKSGVLDADGVDPTYAFGWVVGGGYRPHAEEVRPLRRPVARGARAVLLAGEDDERHALREVALRGLEDRRLLAVREVYRPRALALRHEQVPEADVGEGAAHHHLVVAAPRAVRVEVLALDAGEDVRVGAAEHLALDRLGDRVRDLLGRRPQVSQVYVFAVPVLPQRFGLEVDVHPAGERVGDDERRRGEVVRLHFRMDARLEVAVPREDGADDEVVLRHRLRDRVGQRPRVPDASRAAVADGVEAELLEVLRQTRLVVVLGDHLRARREARLHPRLALEPALDGLLRQ